MEWVEESKLIFKMEKPEHFTDYTHCEECAEHDQTLINSEIETIGLKELGNPGWDPVCFCSEDAKKYMIPAFIRLSLETIDNDFYFGQFLFHLEGDGEENAFYKSCTEKQRNFIVAFLEHMIEKYSYQIERNQYTDEVLRVYQIWLKA